MLWGYDGISDKYARGNFIIAILNPSHRLVPELGYRIRIWIWNCHCKCLINRQRWFKKLASETLLISAAKTFGSFCGAAFVDIVSLKYLAHARTRNAKSSVVLRPTFEIWVKAIKKISLRVLFNVRFTFSFCFGKLERARKIRLFYSARTYTSVHTSIRIIYIMFETNTRKHTRTNNNNYNNN